MRTLNFIRFTSSYPKKSTLFLLNNSYCTINKTVPCKTKTSIHKENATASINGMFVLAA